MNEMMKWKWEISCHKMFAENCWWFCRL